MALLIIFGFVAGAATAVSPCVVPVLPLALSAGAAGGGAAPARGRRRAGRLLHLRALRAGLPDRGARTPQRPVAEHRDRRPLRLRHRPPDPTAGGAGRGVRLAPRGPRRGEVRRGRLLGGGRPPAS